MKNWKTRQQGMSFTGFIMGAVGIVLLAIFGMKLLPPYIHSFQITEIFREIAADQTMQNASAKEIKDSFFKRAMINDINDITAEDIVIERSDGRLVLSASYSVKIPLVANITLLLEFNPSSS